MFYYESQVFNLGDGITYRPDFILPEPIIDGTQIVLEPHGFWKGDHEKQVTEKYSKFRQQFGSFYHLILIVHPNDYTRIRDNYPEAYDDIIESNRMPDLLYMLKTGKYKKIF